MSGEECNICGMKVSNMKVHMKLNHKKRKSITPEGFRFTGFSTSTSTPTSDSEMSHSAREEKCVPGKGKDHAAANTDSDRRMETKYSNRTEILDTQINQMINVEQLEQELKKEDYNDTNNPKILLDTEPNIINANIDVQNDPSSDLVPCNRPKHTELETEEDSNEFETITLELTLVNTENSFGDPFGQDMLDMVNRNVISEIVHSCCTFNAGAPAEHLDERDISFKRYKKRKIKSKKENDHYF